MHFGRTAVWLRQPTGAHASSYRRDSSPPLAVRRGAAPSLPFALAYARGAERQKTHLLKSAPCGAACRLTGTRASRRSTAAIFNAATALRRRTGGPYPHAIQAAFALPFIRRVAAI